MAAAAFSVARKRATHRALVGARFGHAAKRYFGIGAAGQPPYERPMSKPFVSAFALACAGLFGVAPAACSRAQSDAPAPPGSAVVAAAAPLTAGAPAPNVTFALHTGEKLALASLRGKPVIVYFYPKDDTPGCTVEAQEIRDLHGDLKQSGAVVIGVSADAQDSHRAFAEKHALPFLLASDETGQLAKAFGVPLKNGRAARVSFVIGPDGRIKRSFPQVTPKGHAAELLSAISS
jgi:thioredoxin-dependent peroxiredoxin